MTFTEITHNCDLIRRRWTFDWLEIDPPTWEW
jgi:hypothetical protein